MKARKINEELFSYVKDIALMDNIIIDRYIYSNLVYTSLYTKYTRLNKAQIKQIEEYIRGKSLIIHLHASKDTLIKRKQKRNEDEVDSDLFEEINHLFTKIVSLSNLHIHSLEE